MSLGWNCLFYDGNGIWGGLIGKPVWKHYIVLYPTDIQAIHLQLIFVNI